MVVVDLTPDLSVTQGNHLICHMLYGIIVSHDDDGVLIFAVDLFGEGKATRIIWMTELELWLME